MISIKKWVENTSALGPAGEWIDEIYCPRCREEESEKRARIEEQERIKREEERKEREKREAEKRKRIFQRYNRHINENRRYLKKLRGHR